MRITTAGCHLPQQQQSRQTTMRMIWISVLLVLALVGRASALSDPTTRRMQLFTGDGGGLPILPSQFDATACFEALIDSDLNRNGLVERNEYVDFAKAMSPEGLLDSVLEFEDFATAFKLAFASTSCLCNNPTYGGDPGASNCCVGSNAAVRVPVPPYEDPPLEDTLYLNAACSDVLAAAEYVQGTVMPTIAMIRPTASPTASPTVMPISPTSAPVGGVIPSQVTATDRPTRLPTLQSPSIPFFPAALPTQMPTKSPAPTQTAEPSRAVGPVAPSPDSDTATVDFEILVQGASDSYMANLTRAVGNLASLVAATQRRRLDVITVGDPSLTETDIDCPAVSITIEEEDACKGVSAAIILNLVDEPDSAAESFESAMLAAIEDGDLQDELDNLDPNSPVTILTGLATGGGSSGLSTGALVGIIIAIIVVVLLLVGVWYVWWKQPPPPPPSRPSRPAADDREAPLVTTMTVVPTTEPLESVQEGNDEFEDDEMYDPTEQITPGPGPVDPAKIALEEALRTGDWEAVSRAATQMTAAPMGNITTQTMATGVLLMDEPEPNPHRGEHRMAQPEPNPQRAAEQDPYEPPPAGRGMDPPER